MAVEGLADGIEGREADGFCVVVFEDGEVGQGDANAVGELAEGDFAARHHNVKVDEYHGGTSNGKVVFGFDAGGFFDHVFHHAQAEPDEEGGNGGGKGKLKPSSQRQKEKPFGKGAPRDSREQACGGFGKDGFTQNGAEQKEQQHHRNVGNGKHCVGIDENPKAPRFGDGGAVAEVVFHIQSRVHYVGQPPSEKDQSRYHEKGKDNGNNG